MVVAQMSDLVADLRSHLDEANARMWSDVELERWLNEGLRDVARRAEVIQDTATVNVVSGTQQYALSSGNLANMTRVYRVEWVPNANSIYPLEYRDFSNMDSVWWTQQKTTQGYPYWYTMWGFPPSVKLILYPTPSQNGTLNVYYYRTMADVTGTATVEIPNGWHDLAVLYAEYVALRKDSDARWMEAKQLYEDRLGELIDLTRRWTDQAGAYSTSSGFVPGWLYDPGY